jgi:hypothetical protein
MSTSFIEKLNTKNSIIKHKFNDHIPYHCVLQELSFKLNMFECVSTSKACILKQRVFLDIISQCLFTKAISKNYTCKVKLKIRRITILYVKKARCVL